MLSHLIHSGQSGITQDFGPLFLNIFITFLIHLLIISPSWVILLSSLLLLCGPFILLVMLIQVAHEVVQVTAMGSYRMHHFASG